MATARYSYLNISDSGVKRTSSVVHQPRTTCVTDAIVSKEPKSIVAPWPTKTRLLIFEDIA